MSVSARIVSGPTHEPTRAPSAATAGAYVWFAGIVRPTEDGKPIDGLRYEAYRPMMLPLVVGGSAWF
jgi:molybdopterin synthase catalytic subunit